MFVVKKAWSDTFRMSQWLAVAFVLYLSASVLYTLDMRQLSTVAWKAGHLTVSAHIGYWISREAFKKSLSNMSVDMRGICRAIIIAAAVIAFALGM